MQITLVEFCVMKTSGLFGWSVHFCHTLYTCSTLIIQTLADSKVKVCSHQQLCNNYATIKAGLWWCKQNLCLGSNAKDRPWNTSALYSLNKSPVSYSIYLCERNAIYRTTCLKYGTFTALKHSCFSHRWRFGAVGSNVDQINEVTLRRARLVLGWVTVSGSNFWCGKFISV